MQAPSHELQKLSSCAAFQGLNQLLPLELGIAAYLALLAKLPQVIDLPKTSADQGRVAAYDQKAVPVAVQGQSFITLSHMAILTEKGRGQGTQGSAFRPTRTREREAQDWVGEQATGCRQASPAGYSGTLRMRKLMSLPAEELGAGEEALGSAVLFGGSDLLLLEPDAWAGSDAAGLPFLLALLWGALSAFGACWGFCFFFASSASVAVPNVNSVLPSACSVHKRLRVSNLFDTAFLGTAWDSQRPRTVHKFKRP